MTVKMMKTTKNAKSKRVPMRRCIGCMESMPKGNLIRVACYEGVISVDPTGRAKGRGVYLCRNGECMKLARKKKALQRNFGVDISPEEEDAIFQELMEYVE